MLVRRKALPTCHNRSAGDKQKSHNREAIHAVALCRLSATRHSGISLRLWEFERIAGDRSQDWARQMVSQMDVELHNRRWREHSRPGFQHLIDCGLER